MEIYVGDQFTVDGTMYNFLSTLNSKLPILMLSRVDNLVFNEKIYELKGNPYVIVDVIENGWDWDRKETLVVGNNTSKFFSGIGWDSLHSFIDANPPVLYFKRELLYKDKCKRLMPIEYPNFQADYPLQTKEQFNARPISVLNYWGRSHEARLIFHGEVWKNAARKGYAVCDNVYYFNHFMQEEKNENKWVSIWIPHYARIPIVEILKINSLSKLSVSLPGCGIKCFRTTGESIVDSVMVMPEDELAYSYPFVDGENCIRFPIYSIDGISREWNITEAIEKALSNPKLYDIYLEGYKAAKFYQVENYSKYLEKIINEL